MIAAYLGIAIVLMLCLLGVAFVILSEGDIDFSDKEDRYIFFGGGTLIILGILLWPMVIVLAVPVAMCYGLYSLVRLAGMRRRGEL